MVRRLSAFVLAFVITGSPVAAIVCQVTCEASEAHHDMAGMTEHAHHSCALSAPTTGAVVTSVPHVCGHPSDDTVGVQQALQFLDAPALVAIQSFLFLPPDTVAVAARSAHIEQSPPGTAALIAQLRV